LVLEGNVFTEESDRDEKEDVCLHCLARDDVKADDDEVNDKRAEVVEVSHKQIVTERKLKRERERERETRDGKLNIKV
jgi:hypothetical protein